MEGLVTASQSLATVPAILTAAGAGIGTLALGLQGFGDTIKEIGDPEKFAEAIQSLSPAAQQAALEIQYLVQGPLQELKNITQETLFAGVAEELHNFTNQYLPQVQHMTTGIAGAFNDMFSNALNQLMTPDTADSMAVLMNNIVKFFQNMAPAVGPFVDAFVKLTETGSKFLPGFGKSITEMAENFNKFITQAQRDGTLENFMKKGLEAAKAVGDVIWDIGKRLYETFGNKGPEDFKQMLDDIVSAAFGLIDAITGVSRALNDVLKIVQPIVDLMGGWEDVVKRILELWVGWNAVKFTGLLTGLNTVSDTLGVVGPGGKGGKGILGKLATAVGLMGLMDQTFTQGSGNVFGGMAQGAMNGAMAGAIFGWPGAAVGAAVGTVYGAGDAIIDAEAKKRREQEARDREFRSNMGILESQGYKPNNPLDPKSFAGQASDNKPTPGQVDANKDAIGNILDIVTTPTGQHGPPPDAGLPPWAERPVPAPPVDDSGSKRDKLNEYLSNLNPTDFMPTMPTGGMPMMAVPAAGGVPMMTPPMAAPAVGPGPMGVNPGIAQLAQIAKQFGLELTSGKTGREGETGSHHSTGNAGDFSNGSAPTPQMRAFAEYVAQNFAPFIKELIYTDDQGGVNLYNGKPHTYSAGTQAQHRNHVHVALTEQAAMGALTPMPPLQYGTGGQPYAQPGWGYYDVDPVGVMKAQHRLEREAHDVALARMELQAKRDLGYTLHEIREAENKVKEEEIQWMEAYQDLIEAQQGTWKEVNQSRGSGGGMGTLGPGIDADFGLSKGLGGLAENLIKFVGSLAMSPILAALNQFTQGESDGYGLMGILGAQWFNQSVDMPYGPGGVPNFAMTTNLPQFTSFGPPGSKQAIANMIYQMARQRGYSAHEAQSIVAYAIGESGLDPTISGGVQGDDEVIGLFQQKSAFARANGIDPSQRSDPYANTWAYLNALDKTRTQNPGMPIEQLLPKTSVGGPLASGPGAQPQAWGPLMAQAAQLLNMPAGAAPTPTSSPWVPTSATGSGPGWFGLPSLSNVPSMGGSVLPGSGMPQSPAFTGGGAGGGGTVSPSYTLGGAAGGTSFTTPTPTDHAPGEGGWQPAGGGTLGIGGIPMAALGSATSAGGLAVDAMAPGAGQVAAAAAQTGVQLANRAIGYAGQLGAVAVNGLLETFGLSDSVIGDPQKSWIGRVATGLASARPALPNVAGQSKPPAPPPQQQQQDPNYQNHSGSGQPPGPTVNIESFVQAPNRNSQQTVQDLAFAMYANR
ncbi:gp15 protein [Mycolicibacterium phlei RIVM601174]|nr:gp15 protein [Mycolicibacterium phlei RIVM601174]